MAAAIVTDPGVEGSLGRLIRALLLLTLGLMMALGAAVADVYLHRGIETSAEPGMCSGFRARAIDQCRSALIYRSADRSDRVHITIERFQDRTPTVSWSEIESTQGEYLWDRYDPIVRNLNDAGIQIVAVVEDAPIWLRSRDRSRAPSRRPQMRRTTPSFSLNS
ncbi:MAG: hypothetical protein QM692_05025 [Thermomicrobiales bacterium]